MIAPSVKTIRKTIITIEKTNSIKLSNIFRTGTIILIIPSIIGPIILKGNKIIFTNKFYLPSLLGSFSLKNFSIFSKVRGYPSIFIFSPTVFASGIDTHRIKYANIPKPPKNIDKWDRYVANEKRRYKELLTQVGLVEDYSWKLHNKS